jgi:hypothetical protein
MHAAVHPDNVLSPLDHAFRPVRKNRTRGGRIATSAPATTITNGKRNRKPVRIPSPHITRNSSDESKFTTAVRPTTQQNGAKLPTYCLGVDKRVLIDPERPARELVATIQVYPRADYVFS